MNDGRTLTISSSTLFALAKQSKNLGAYKMARTAYDKLQVCEDCYPRGSSQKIGLGCAARFPNPSPYFRPKSAIPIYDLTRSLRPNLRPDP